jgi:SNF2 family DNA or RNA helicase
VLVVPASRKLVMDTPSYAQVSAAIPHAKEFVHDGQKLLALHHGVEETLVLKNFGFSVPAPILSYYDWPARFQAMQHQKDTAAFLTTNRRALVLNSPGTGKTLSAIWAADFLLSEGIAKRILVVAPLSTLTVVWAREIRHHLPHRTFAVITGSRERRERQLGTPGCQYFIINHDGLTHNQHLLQDFDVVIYDEATALKSPSSARYKVFSKWLAARDPWLWLLTGTPISQSPADAWTLARLVGSATCPKSYTTFKDMVMQKLTTFKWVARPNALEVVKKVLQPSIRFSLDECKDLPDTNFVGRQTTLTAQQQRAFKEMQAKAVTFFAGTEVAAPNAAVVLSKLLQICCGVVYSDDTRIEIDAADRYNTFTELIDEIDGKVIVFCPLRGVQDWLYESLTKAGYDVATVHGGVTGAARNQIFNDFQHTDGIKVLLAHPRVAAHGLTLTRAKDIIWFAPIYSLESYEQANARIRRLSTEGKTTVWHIYATPFEAELYRRLRTKQRVLGEFLNLVQGINDDV